MRYGLVCGVACSGSEFEFSEDERCVRQNRCQRRNQSRSQENEENSGALYMGVAHDVTIGDIPSRVL